MTYATMQAQTLTPFSASEDNPYEAVGTDEAEYKKWQALVGSTGLGEVVYDDDASNSFFAGPDEDEFDLD